MYALTKRILVMKTVIFGLSFRNEYPVKAKPINHKPNKTD